MQSSRVVSLRLRSASRFIPSTHDHCDVLTVSEQSLRNPGFSESLLMRLRRGETVPALLSHIRASLRWLLLEGDHLRRPHDALGSPTLIPYGSRSLRCRSADHHGESSTPRAIASAPAVISPAAFEASPPARKAFRAHPIVAVAKKRTSAASTHYLSPIRATSPSEVQGERCRVARGHTAPRLNEIDSLVRDHAFSQFDVGESCTGNV